MSMLRLLYVKESVHVLGHEHSTIAETRCVVRSLSAEYLARRGYNHHPRGRCHFAIPQRPSQRVFLEC
ncbi:hypothetical protein quinque_014005 [Culex quinquefasciatus]